jgi:HEAT repeat protein
MKRTTYLFILFIALTTAASSWAQSDSAFSMFADPQAAAADTADRTAYDKGQSLLDQNHYGDAVQVFTQMIAAKSPRTDAAMYWRAYALSKLGRKNEALTQLTELRKAYPQSKWWTNDGAALLAELNPQAAQKLPSSSENEEMKLLAIQSLMNSDDARAFPMLENVLKSPNNSTRVKERALFVLAQSDDPKAQAAIQNIARGKDNPTLQCKAIEMIGTQGNKESINALVDIYNTSPDVSVRKCVLHGFLVSDAKDNVLAVAKNEKDQSLRIEAIHQLGVMDAQPELRQMFQNAQTVEDKKAIIEAASISDDTELLTQVAKTAPEVEVRRAAIHGLGINDSKAARATLLNMYPTERAKDAKVAIVEALFIQDDAHDLISLYNSEGDHDMKRDIAEKLSVMDNKEAHEFMIEILNK